MGTIYSLHGEELQRYRVLLDQYSIIKQVDSHLRLQGGKVLIVGGDCLQYYYANPNY